MTISNFFIPNRQNIQNISRTNPGIVTTSQAHGYSSGLFVRLYLPADFGMQQVSNQVYSIVVLSPTTFSISQNTSSFDAFSLSVTTQTPQVIPVGNESPGLLESEKNNGNIIPET